MNKDEINKNIHKYLIDLLISTKTFIEYLRGNWITHETTLSAYNKLFNVLIVYYIHNHYNDILSTYNRITKITTQLSFLNFVETDLFTRINDIDLEIKMHDHYNQTGYYNGGKSNKTRRLRRNITKTRKN